MENSISFWKKLGVGKLMDIFWHLISGPIYEPPPVGENLFSPPFTLSRGLLGLAGLLAVPNTGRVVVRGQRGFCRTFGPGVHSLHTCPSGRLCGQLVDMSQHSLEVGLDNLNTVDLAQVSLLINVEFKVDDPQAIIQIASPLQSLTRMAESAARRVIEALLHRSLFGDANVSQVSSKSTLERQIRLTLLAEPALKGLRILSIKIVKVEGDPDHLRLAAQAILAERKLLAEEADLQARRLLANDQRELVLFEAQTERMAAFIKGGVAVDDARRQTDIFNLENAHREYERMMVETKLAHERALARIGALGQAVSALADPRHLAVANATYGHNGYTDGRDQALAQVIDNLVEQDAVGAPTSSNGHSSQ